MNTCDKCKHWSTDAEEWKGGNGMYYEKYKEQGACAMFGDSNDWESGAQPPPRNDVCYGWDYESYKSGVIVMAKFGCIHWEEK